MIGCVRAGVMEEGESRSRGRQKPEQRSREERGEWE